MTLRQRFQINDGNVKLLREILNHPVLQEAIRVASEETQVKMAAPVPGVDFATQMAINGAESYGAETFRRKLLSLVDLPVTMSEVPQTGLNSAAIQSMVSSGQYTKEEAEEAVKKSTTR